MRARQSDDATLRAVEGKLVLVVLLPTVLGHSVGHSRNPIKCVSSARSFGSAACCKIRCMT